METEKTRKLSVEPSTNVLNSDISESRHIFVVWSLPPVTSFEPSQKITTQVVPLTCDLIYPTTSAPIATWTTLRFSLFESVATAISCPSAAHSFELTLPKRGMRDLM